MVTAKLITTINVKDPNTGGNVELEVYKHQNGGMFAIDSSFIDQVLSERVDNGECEFSIYDPFADMGDPQELHLID